MPSPLKLLLAGDGAVGKTCLLVVYAQGQLPVEYLPTIFENYKCTITVNKAQYDLHLWDSAGREEFEAIRLASYHNTHVFILCFSVVDRESYENIKKKWIIDIRERVPDAVLLLVGTKTDLRPASALSVSPADGHALARDIGAIEYVETSAIDGSGVNDVFTKAILRALDRISPGIASDSWYSVHDRCNVY
jgi:small GTP-binding protein